MSKGKSRIQPRVGKGKYIAPHPPSIDPDKLPPIFSFEYLDNGDYCLTKCQQHEKAALADTMHRLSRVSWIDLRLAGRHGLGCEKIPRRQIRGAIPAHITDDVGFFLAFRFCAMAPMVGYRDGRIFYVLWLDRAFTLYDH